MKAIGKYIVVKSIEEQITTDSGLLLSSEDVKDLRYKKGEVINSGTEVDAIKNGDVLYFDKHGSHTMMIENEAYTIIQERNVVVVV
tara:strand:- start:2704 stop:2961 length:258 start_codon:yes stop_codon:yes gene_type:complete